VRRRKLIVPNVALADENASVVDGLGQTQFENLGLETTLQEILDLQAEYVIELHAALFKHADTDQTTQKGVTYWTKIQLLDDLQSTI